MISCMFSKISWMSASKSGGLSPYRLGIDYALLMCDVVQWCPSRLGHHVGAPYMSSPVTAEADFLAPGFLFRFWALLVFSHQVVHSFPDFSLRTLRYHIWHREPWKRLGFFFFFFLKEALYPTWGLTSQLWDQESHTPLNLWYLIRLLTFAN